jgi:predicted metalloprotease with PDZ domain
MRALWRGHGLPGIGVDEEGVELLAEEVTGLRLKPLFDAWLRSTAELPLARLLATHGLKLAARPAESASDRGGKAASPEASPRPTIGVRSKPEGKDALLTHVLDGGAAQRAGLSAGDVVVALDGIRLRNGALDDALAQRRPGDEVKVHAFRRDELHEFRIQLERPGSDTVWIEESDKSNRLRDRWLKNEG